jgi:pyruvate/2-oxoglutarate dehydrogenase complex dihydrolipoamide acyltransferase (E2) component
VAYELYLPDIGEGLTEADIVEWHLSVGDPVAANQAIVSVETAKAVVDIPSPRDGTILHRGADEGSTLKVGFLLVVIGDAGEDWSFSGGTEPLPDSEPESSTEANGPTVSHARVKAVPLLRKMARDLGVDMALVTPTGARGQITRNDIRTAASDLRAGSTTDAPQKMSMTRRTIAANMVKSWTEIPHVTVWRPVDATAMLAALSATAVPLEALLIEAALTAMERYPAVNSLFDGDVVTTSPEANIGIAVDTDAGLMVPIVKAADSLTRIQRAMEINRLVAGAGDRSLTMDDLQGGTFTISNVGAVGGGYGTPIIPHGTVAILSIGRAVQDVIVRNDEIVIAPVFPMAMSFDHRVLDGAYSSKFFASFCEAVRTFSR